jgi:hypothetical protein
MSDRDRTAPLRTPTTGVRTLPSVAKGDPQNRSRLGPRAGLLARVSPVPRASTARIPSKVDGMLYGVGPHGRVVGVANARVRGATVDASPQGRALSQWSWS